MNVRLIEPEQSFLASYREAGEDYRACGIDDYTFSDQGDPFEKFRNYKSGIGLKPGRVAATYYWLVSDKRFIGEIVIRRELNAPLERYGGHIGYGIRRDCWNQGLGTKMLALALEKAREMGLARVLVTCDDDNPGSARVIEKNGGRLEDVIENRFGAEIVLTRRYWIEL